MTDTQWRWPSDYPDSGESIWVVVREHDGRTHVDYAVAFDEVDGLYVKIFEEDKYAPWPPNDVVAWMVADVPVFNEGVDSRTSWTRFVDKLPPNGSVLVVRSQKRSGGHGYSLMIGFEKEHMWESDWSCEWMAVGTVE